MPRIEAIKGTDLRTKLLDRLVSEPDEFIARVASLFETRDPDNVLQTLRLAIQEGKMPVLVANHQSVSDGIALANITSQLGICFNLPVAASIDDGHQGDVIKLLNKYVAPDQARRNLFSVPIVTKGDEEKRGMHKESNRTGLGVLLGSAANGRGFAMFPEATVTGGRTDESSQINGLMLPPDPHSLTRWLKAFEKKGHSPVVVPIGIDGSYKVFSPDYNFFPEDVIKILLGTVPTTKVATITLGSIIPFSQVPVESRSDDFFMAKIAALLPESARGAYAHPSH